MKKSVSLLIQNSSRQFLIIQRSQDCKNFEGWWEFPGGKIDGDESPLTALGREVQEEIGVAMPAISEPTGCTIRVPGGAVEYAFFSWFCGDTPCLVRLSNEHQAYKWVRFTEVRRIQNFMAPHREFMERYWHAQQVSAYEGLLPRYALFERTLRTVLDRLRERWAPLAIVQARAKTLSSFAEKCLRKADKYDDPAHELTDLCGGRIVTTTLSEADTLCRQVRKLFAPVDEEDDTRTRHDSSAFGYLSVHFLIHFPCGVTEMLGVPIPPEITGLKCEIQVRTLLQHAHSEVTHDRLYKSGFAAPKHCAREAARVAAMLENGDAQFARFVDQLDAYVRHYAAHLPPAKRRREIENLRLVLSHEKSAARKPDLALRIGRLHRAAWEWRAVVETLEPFADSASLVQPWIQVELGNALCRPHGDVPQDREFRRGLALLEIVAVPNQATDAFLERDEKDCRATALAWLGSALSMVNGRRADARAALAKAVELMPEDPYHLTDFVELDVIAAGTDDHLLLLAPALRQAAGRCAEHIAAGIEITRAWLTLARIRLLLSDEEGAVEALCLAAHSTDNHRPLTDFHALLDRLKDAIGQRRPFVAVLSRVAQLLAKAKEHQSRTERAGLDWDPLTRQFEFRSADRVLVLAGSTRDGNDCALANGDQILDQVLTGYSGYVVTGGTGTGVCGLTARAVQRLGSKGEGGTELVGYLPGNAAADPAFRQIVRTAGTVGFSVLEPVQMWCDLLLSGVNPARVTLLCVGGGVISAQELALAWALGARTAAVAGDSPAPRRFAALLAIAGAEAGRGMILPADRATLSAFVPFDLPVDARRWDKPGQAIHKDYVENQHRKSRQPNLLPWSLLREDFKHSNRHQAACSVEILRQCGFLVEPVETRTNELPLIEFSTTDLDRLAELEHGRWNVERLNSGWRRGAKKDEERKLSPWLVPWAELPEEIRGYDRNAVLAWPQILAQAGLCVRRE